MGASTSRALQKGLTDDGQRRESLRKFQALRVSAAPTARHASL